MVKSYLRYEARRPFGVVASATAQCLFDASGRLAIVPALENVLVWNLRTGTRIAELPGEHSAVSAMALRPDGKQLAVGYADGRVKLWTLSDAVCVATLAGHKAAVSALAFNASGSQLASGSKDTEIVVWDPLAESGLFRLQGHKDEVTELRFLSRAPLLLSSSKDATLKAWDLDSLHCVDTVAAHRSEVWSFAVNADETRLVSGSNDREINVFELTPTPAASAPAEPGSSPGRLMRLLGSLPQTADQRVVAVRFNAHGDLLGVQTTSRLLQLFHVRAPEEARRKARRRAQRAREKERAKAGGAAAAATAATAAPEDASAPVAVTVADEFGALLPLRAERRVRGFSFAPAALPRERPGPKSVADHVLLSLHDNSTVLYQLRLSENTSDEAANALNKVAAIELPGHRSGVRALAISSDGRLLASASAENVKIWNASSHQCIRTLQSGYGLCVMMVPGDRHCLVGTKEGHIELWDIGSATLLARVDAHEGPVWALDNRPDGRGFVSGGSDKEVKFWDFELVAAQGEDGEALPQKQLSIVLTRTMKMTDDVMCLKHSPDGKLLAVGLLDYTVRVFFEDSLKFFVSLYGHKLPVLSIDISSDNALLVSGSADKSVKIWGLDFGDCHRSLRAHDDSVMRVQFVKDTHYFFSCGKDRLLKQWDADTFQLILSLPGHHGEVWGLAVSPDGSRVFTGGLDMALREWERTEEPLFLEEERERELERAADETAVPQQGAVGEAEGASLAAVTSTAVVDAAHRGNVEGLRASERIAQALELAREEDEREKAFNAAAEASRAERTASKRHRALLSAYRKGVENMGLEEEADEEGKAEEEEKEEKADGASAPASFPRNPFLRGLSTDDYVLETVKGVRSSDLEDGLSLLSLEQAVALLARLRNQLAHGSGDVELLVRCVVFLVTLHQSQLIASKTMSDALPSLAALARSRLRQRRNELGFNTAALRMARAEARALRSSFAEALPRPPAPAEEPNARTGKRRRERQLDARQ